MTKRIFRSIVLVALAVLLASLALVLGVLYDYFSDLQRQQLITQVELAAQGADHEGEGYFKGLDSETTRITWIAADGTVLYDSQGDETAMENHLERQEVQDALATGFGESTRYSDTTMQNTIYAAKRLDDGTILRLSMAHNSVWRLLLGAIHPIIIIVIVALVLSLLLAYRLSANIVRPLNNLNLEKPMSNSDYEELEPLLHRIDSQQRQLQQQRRQMQRRQDEWQTVTGNMNEGLVLIGASGDVLSLNPAAARLLDAGHYVIGEPLHTIGRAADLQPLLDKALTGAQAEQILDIKGERYQCDASPVLSEGQVDGVVLLLFNVTERERAAQIRQEFTANVSHELKTPLHSISGYAELLGAGMVRAEDVAPFAGKIHREAQRMVQLVEDILHLSHLEEGALMPKESVDLFEIAQKAVDSLRLAADHAHVSLQLTGDPVKFLGVAPLLYSVVYNLCDNAIKYNRPDGRVTVQVRQSEDQAVLQVADTGIGMAEEHHSRIFERFYRVDKSHSKEVGGTGLGLSIVKHAVRIHNGRIDLRSTPNDGTTVTVYFPKDPH